MSFSASAVQMRPTHWCDFLRSGAPERHLQEGIGDDPKGTFPHLAQLNSTSEISLQSEMEFALTRRLQLNSGDHARGAVSAVLAIWRSLHEGL